MLTEKQKELLADKLADLANLTVAALVLGNIIIREGWRIVIILAGAAISVLLYAFVLFLRR